MADESMSFDEVKARLDEIAQEVGAEGISLDDALALYEEAVKLGLAACDLSEKDILQIKEESDETMAQIEELKREAGITGEDIARAAAASGIDDAADAAALDDAEVDASDDAQEQPEDASSEDTSA